MERDSLSDEENPEIDELNPSNLRKRNYKKMFLVLFFLLLFIASTTFSYVYFTYSRVVVDEEESVVEKEKASDFDLSPLPTLPANVLNILLLGYGGEGHSGGMLADSLMVLHINADREFAALISVPRDAFIELPSESGGKVNRKINNSYAIGGGKLARQVVGQIIGMPVKYFVSVSFSGFKDAIDILEGAEVDVPVAFDDYYYPVKGKEIEACGKTVEEVEEILTTLKGFEIDKQFPCRFEHIHFDKGKQLMDGETALKFVRSRHSAQHGGDFARGERQQALLLGIFDKLISLGAIDDAIPFFNKLSHTIKTDIDEDVIEELISLIVNPDEYELVNVNLSTENVFDASTGSGGQFILIPKEGIGKWDKVNDYVRKRIEILHKR